MESGEGFNQMQESGKFKPIYWNDIKKYNQSDSLPPYLKLKYDAWLAGNIEQAGKITNINTTDKFTTDTKKFKEMLEESEKKILSGNKKNKKKKYLVKKKD